MNILFRADSSSTIGLGHIMRDLVLASQYKDANIVFATQDLNGNINEKIKESGHTVEILQSNALEEVVSLIARYSIDLVVIDHYDINDEYERQLKEKTGVRILSFDDTYQKHYCDILLNHNLSAKKEKYLNLVPADCELRCGSKFTLIRDEFKEAVIKNRHINNTAKLIVFVAMGGSDSQNINMKILKVLTKFKNIYIHLVTSSSNTNVKRLHQYISNKKNIKLHINSKDMAYLMNKAHIAIISPSVIAAEVIYMRLPFIAIKTADNQNDIYRFFHAKRLLTLNTFNATKLISLVEKLATPKQYNQIKNRIQSFK